MFRVGLTRDLLKPAGTLGFGDIGLNLFASTNIAWEYLLSLDPEILPKHAPDYMGCLFSLREPVPGPFKEPGVSESWPGSVSAMTMWMMWRPAQAWILLTITPEGVHCSVAVVAMALALALSRKLLLKDRLTHEGRWSGKLKIPLARA